MQCPTIAHSSEDWLDLPQLSPDVEECEKTDLVMPKRQRGVKGSRF